MALVTWHAWRGNERVAIREYPPTEDARSIRSALCDELGRVDRVTCVRPLPGMLATVSIGSDSYPYEIVKVSPSASVLTLRGRQARGPMTIEDPNGKIVSAHRQGDGSYRVGRTCRVFIGAAEAYCDPSF